MPHSLSALQLFRGGYSHTWPARPPLPRAIIKPPPLALPSHSGGKFKKWEESSARVIKCDEPSVHQRDEFVGHETDLSDYVNPDRQLSGLDTNPKPSCECTLTKVSLLY